MTQSIWPEEKNCLTPPHRKNLLKRLEPELKEWLHQRNLPESLLATTDEVYLPLAAYLARETEEKGCRIIGLTGGQGAGKSTLSGLLTEILSHGFDKRVVTFSIDDIYLSHAERKQLATDIHPLLATRGVPGTHDPLLGLYLLQQLKVAEEGDIVLLPVFDKAIDDRLPPEQWRIATGPFDLIIFEGWCVGTMPQIDEDLLVPINDLERREDRDGLWRQFVNDELSGPYIELFALIDTLVMLKVPGMEQVFEWRLKQEEQLSQRHQGDPSTKKIMDENTVRRFIQHYERITLSMLQEMPERADIVIELNEQQQTEHIRVR